MQAFPRRSAWCHATRRASLSWPTLTWSDALTAPSRSCRLLPLALCSALSRPGVGLPGPGAHNCTTAEDQAHGNDISMATAEGQGLLNLSHIHWPCPPGRLFLKCIFFSFLKPCSWKLINKKKKTKRTSCDEYDDIFLDLGNITWETNHVVSDFFPAFIVYFYNWDLFFWGGCTKILIFCYFYGFCVSGLQGVRRELKSHTQTNTRAD